MIYTLDANRNLTTHTHQYVGPNYSTGLVTQTVKPAIALDAFATARGGTSFPPTRLPPTPHAFPAARPVKGKTRYAGGIRKRWVDEKGIIYEWDSLHAKVEKYDKTGRHHLGEFDPDTGEQTKPAEPGRRVER